MKNYSISFQEIIEVHPKGFEPPSSEPESEILSIELWVQKGLKPLRRLR